MSLATWRAEFYPIPASEATESDTVAVEYSLVKWRGLRPEALERHGVGLYGMSVREPDGESDDLPARFPVDGNTCALCQKHNKLDVNYATTCAGCPIVAVREGVPCDSREAIDKALSPWLEFTKRQNSEPMIQWLEKAKAFVAQRDGGK